MAVRVNIKKDNNRIPEIIADLNKLNNMKAHVGYRDGDLAKIAAVHEFGVKIKVTDKMRGYLASQGLFLKKSTTHIVIPERSFLRTGADLNEKEVMEKAELLLPQVIEGNINPKEFYDMLALELKDRVQDFARDLDSPPNHPFTIERKGSDNPLINTGDMITRMESFVE